MKHRSFKKQFGRSKSQHKAIIQNLFYNLVRNKSIKTSVVKAKTLKVYTDKIISKGKKENASKNKTIIKVVPPGLMSRFMKLTKRYKKRVGGYTRVIKINNKRADQAQMAIIKWVKFNETGKAKNL